MKYVACVGDLAFWNRITVDLECHPRDRRIIVVQNSHDMERLRGLRGPDVWWVDMGATLEQMEYCAVREFKKVALDHAREGLRTAGQG